MNLPSAYKYSIPNLQVTSIRKQKRKRNLKYNTTWDDRSNFGSNVSKSEVDSRRRLQDGCSRFSQNEVPLQQKTFKQQFNANDSRNTVSRCSTRHFREHPDCLFSSHHLSINERPPYQEDLSIRGLLVKRSLGSGSYSKVKHALDTRSNFTDVAVKIVDRCNATEDYLSKFLPREISLWLGLNHPNLVELIDCFEENMRVYMILEYAPGGDALNFVQKNGPLEENQAKNWFNQIASALSYMHRLNIAHRDLKLENLLLFEDGNKIKLGDFGFVKNVCSPTDLSNTFCGSKAYAAPEILSGKSYDPKKGDIWALGVVLYIILTGKMPFNETRGIKNILNEQSKLNLLELSPPTHKLIMKIFNWNVSSRPNIESVRQDPWLIPACFK